MTEPAVLEFWRDVINYGEDYQVSDLGRVRSLKRRSIKILHGSKDRKNYLRVHLRRPDDGNKLIQIHRLVAQHFLDDWDPALTVNHINYDKADNRVSNLEMMTHSQNASNRRKISEHTSRFRGVSWYSRYNKWLADLGRDGKQKHVGYFTDEEDAAHARDDYIREKGWEDDYKLNFESETDG